MPTFWFPPRLVMVDPEVNEDPNDVCDRAVELYLDEGIAPLEGENIVDCYKIINFAKQFPDL